MAAPLIDRSTGDIIPASDHNDVKDYIEDGTYRVNTLALSIQAAEVISQDRYVKPVRIVSTGAGGILFYASNGSTQIAVLDENGNLGILGSVYQL